MRSMSEGTDRLITMLTAFDSRVQAAKGGDWSRPAPCEGWTARDVVDHVANNVLNLTAGLTGSEPKPMAADEDTVVGWERALAAANVVLPTADMINFDVSVRLTMEAPPIIAPSPTTEVIQARP